MAHNTFKNKYVCSACFGDRDLKKFIETTNDRPGCGFCGQSDAETASVADVFSYILEKIEENFTSSNKVNNRDVEGAGCHESLTWGRYSSRQLLECVIKIELPRDKEKSLIAAICSDSLGDKKWCSREYGVVSRDKELRILWNIFEASVKHGRRFSLDRSIVDATYSPISIFNKIETYLRILIRPLPVGRLIFRIRKSQNGEKFDRVDELGPPPPNAATQSNRMNPPGIPYFYGAEMEETARMEAQVKAEDGFSMGVFEVKKQINVVDLVNLPERVGYFAKASLDDRQSINFLHIFSEEISKPIAGDDRVNLDYIPTQVFAELIRDKLEVSGIRYKSSYNRMGVNIVLFISSNEIEGGKKHGVFPDNILKQVYATSEIIRLRKVEHTAGNIGDKTIRTEGP